MKYNRNQEKRYFLTYEEEEEGLAAKDIAQRILTDLELPQLKSIVIGSYGASWDECSSQEILDSFVEHKEKLSHIESFFIGDMDSEECEISWITQGNYESFIKSFPNMKQLIIKGSNDLVLGNMEHNELRSLKIICGGIPKSVLQEVSNAKLPNLEILTLYLGIDDYGFDGSLEDIKPLVSKQLFPRLQTLGLVNSDIQDEITKIILDSDILPQLKKLQLSYGTLSDIGGQYILDNVEKIKHLVYLDCEFNYLSNSMLKKLEQLPMEVNVLDQQEDDEEYGNWPMVTE